MGHPAHEPRADPPVSAVPSPIRWGVAAGSVCLAWVAGLLLWGAPEPGFAASSPVFWWAALVVVGAPLLVAGSVAIGLAAGARPWARSLSAAFWVVGLLAVAYLTQFVHFGGFCLDPGDACVISWPARVVSLLLAIGIVAVAAASELAAVRWRGRRDNP